MMVPALPASSLWIGSQPVGAEPTSTTGAKSSLTNPEPKTELFAAVAEAKRTGRPAVVPFRTTETSTTFVTPEEKYVTEVAAGPVRVQQPDGTWLDIDTSLVETGGVLRPKVAKVDVRFSTGGQGPFATMNREAGKTLAMSWPTQLPKPEVQGNTATYRGVAGAGIQVRRLTGLWDPNTQTWAPQPTNTTEDAAVSIEGSVLGSCGSGTMTWDVTPIVAKWAAGSTLNHGLVLQSPNETATTNYRVFASAENTDGLAPPTLSVTSDTPFTSAKEGWEVWHLLI